MCGTAGLGVCRGFLGQAAFWEFDRHEDVGGNEFGRCLYPIHLGVRGPQLERRLLGRVGVRDVTQLPGLKVLKGLNQFLAGVHHEWPVPGDRLSDRQAAE